ncbi:MAG: NGG1p interacting factor NIF3 [Patescibacteria group bacterium]|jgi:putative NIF3 family GTP cyclohydrolase 1 type 2
MLNVKEVFELGIKMGIAADPRGKKGVERYLAIQKKEYDKLSDKEKKNYDKEKITNPYLDCGIHVDDGKTKVGRVLVGIDIGEAEILLASQLNERGKPIDLVISHHPEGKGLAGLADVMEMSVEVYESYGVPIHFAEKIHDERMKIVGRSIHPGNLYKAVDVAKILKVNFMSAHTLCDNQVDKYVREQLEKANPYTLGDIMDVLMEIPEYVEATKMGFGPKIVAGSPKSRAGKYILEMTGGTEPSNKVYEYLSRAGMSTAISMHMREDHLTKANEYNLNVVMAGHMSSDSLGVNLFLDELEKNGVEIVPCGGLIRYSRNKKKK